MNAALLLTNVSCMLDDQTHMQCDVTQDGVSVHMQQSFNYLPYPVFVTELRAASGGAVSVNDFIDIVDLLTGNVGFYS